jgi:hypothetical protein
MPSECEAAETIRDRKHLLLALLMMTAQELSTAQGQGNPNDAS